MWPTYTLVYFILTNYFWFRVVCDECESTAKLKCPPRSSRRRAFVRHLLHQGSIEGWLAQWVRTVHRVCWCALVRKTLLHKACRYTQVNSPGQLYLHLTTRLLRRHVRMPPPFETDSPNCSTNAGCGASLGITLQFDQQILDNYIVLTSTGTVILLSLMEKSASFFLRKAKESLYCKYRVNDFKRAFI